MKQRPASVLLGLALLCATPLAPAQSTAPAEESPQRYTVEVIVFTQPPMGEARSEQADESATPLPDRPSWLLEAAGAGLTDYRPLPASRRTLTRTARRIDAREGFAVHWHAVWEQPGMSRATAQPVALPEMSAIPGLSGYIKISRERFRHARIELRYARGESVHWVMSQSRRLRGEQPHYFDHPVLGAVIRVEPTAAD